MSLRRTTTKTDEAVVDEKHAFDRQFKYALIVYAVVELVALALFVYYKVSR